MSEKEEIKKEKEEKEIQQTKVCYKCSELKDINYFNKRSNMNRSNQCKDCQREYERNLRKEKEEREAKRIKTENSLETQKQPKINFTLALKKEYQGVFINLVNQIIIARPEDIYLLQELLQAKILEYKIKLSESKYIEMMVENC